MNSQQNPQIINPVLPLRLIPSSNRGVRAVEFQRREALEYAVRVSHAACCAMVPHRNFPFCMKQPLEKLDNNDIALDSSETYKKNIHFLSTELLTCFVQILVRLFSGSKKHSAIAVTHRLPLQTKTSQLDLTICSDSRCECLPSPAMSDDEVLPGAPDKSDQKK
jgi:hypothetical protein